MILKDQIRFSDDNYRGHQNGNWSKKEVCKRFNKGKCTAGLSCKYKHKCLECGKFGHGAHTVGRLQAHKQGVRAAVPLHTQMQLPRHHSRQEKNSAVMQVKFVIA